MLLPFIHIFSSPENNDTKEDRESCPRQLCFLGKELRPPQESLGGTKRPSPWRKVGAAPVFQHVPAPGTQKKTLAEAWAGAKQFTRTCGLHIPAWNSELITGRTHDGQMGGSGRKESNQQPRQLLNLAWSPKQDLIKLILHTSLHPPGPVPRWVFAVPRLVHIITWASTCRSP